MANIFPTMMEYYFPHFVKTNPLAFAVSDPGHMHGVSAPGHSHAVIPNQPTFYQVLADINQWFEDQSLIYSTHGYSPEPAHHAHIWFDGIRFKEEKHAIAFKLRFG